MVSSTALVVVNKQLLTGYAFKYGAAGRTACGSARALATAKARRGVSGRRRRFDAGLHCSGGAAAATLGGFHMAATALANWLLGVTAGVSRADIPFRGAGPPTRSARAPQRAQRRPSRRRHRAKQICSCS